jgi:hypothetical protein
MRRYGSKWCSAFPNSDHTRLCWKHIKSYFSRCRKLLPVMWEAGFTGSYNIWLANWRIQIFTRRSVMHDSRRSSKGKVTRKKGRCGRWRYETRASPLVITKKSISLIVYTVEYRKALPSNSDTRESGDFHSGRLGKILRKSRYPRQGMIHGFHSP